MDICISCASSVHRGQKRVSDSLELELQSHYMGTRIAAQNLRQSQVLLTSKLSIQAQSLVLVLLKGLAR